MKTNKFELLKLDPNNLVELDQWETKLKTLVDENPFIEITDKKTFDEAKKRRTALKSGRTEVQKQDGLIATFLNNFRKSTKAKNEMLVSIVQPHEDKQQIEIDRFQAILDKEKEEKERLENERIDGIKNRIDDCKKQFQSIIDHLVFENIDSAIQDFKNYYQSCIDENDFQEFDFLFVESAEQLEKEFHFKIDDVKIKESQRIQNLQNDRERIINKMIIDGQQIVDDVVGTIDEKLVRQMVSGVFQTMLGCDVEFDDESNEKVKLEKQKCLDKVSKKISLLKENEISQQRQRIFDVREGLLDLVFQMTIDNHEQTNKTIFEAFDKEVIPEVQQDFDKMKSMVNQSLVQKMESINKEIQAVKDAKEKEEKLFLELIDQRLKKLIAIGMNVDQEQNVSGFDFYWDKYQIGNFHNEDFEEMLNEIQLAKNKNENEQKRQELIRQDKITMIDIFVNFKNQINEKKPKGLFDNDESIQYFDELKNHFIEYCDERISNINKF